MLLIGRRLPSFFLFFSECQVSFFSFSLFSIGKVLQCLFTFFLYALFVCCAFVFLMESVNLSDHLWCKSTLTFSFSDALKRKICFSCVCFFQFVLPSLGWSVCLYRTLFANVSHKNKFI